MEAYTQLFIEWGIKIFVFLLILWAGKRASAKVADHLQGYAFFERAKVEGFADLPKLLYYILLFATWYVALNYIGIDLTFLVNFVLTNVTIVFSVTVAAFGLAWALSNRSQEQASGIVTHFAQKVRELFIGTNSD